MASKIYRSNTVDSAAYKSSFTGWFSTLDDYVQSVVWDYTDGGYRKLNSYLRSSGQQVDCELEKARLTLSEALTSLPYSKNSNSLLYRGVKAYPGFDLPSRFNVGEEVLLKPFTSTTSDPHQVFKFTDHEKPIIFEFEGVEAREVSDIHNEFEFLVDHNSSFIVTHVMMGVDWHAEYAGTDFSRSLNNATVIQLKQNNLQEDLC